MDIVDIFYFAAAAITVYEFVLHTVKRVVWKWREKKNR